MSRRYNIDTIRSLRTDPRNVEAVIHDLYGTDAQKEKSEYFVSDVAGGSGRSCQFQTTGRYAGRFRDFNPAGTKEQGAIEGLRPHGPHSVRHILATTMVKLTGGFSEAAALLMDTEEMVRDNYARFLPGERHARAQGILLHSLGGK